ncbi:MAG: glycosyl hydrolase family 28-related protein [Gammaproteobacteria bacterium]
MLIALGCAFALVSPGRAAADADGVRARHVPADYSGFVTAPARRKLTTASLGDGLLYLKPGEYRVDNPIVIDTAGAVLVHGFDRFGTTLIPAHADEPLFVVKRAAYVGLAGLRLGGFERDGGVNLLARTDAPVVVDVQDCFIESGSVVLAGPGAYRLQGNFLDGRGRVAAQLVVEHVDADVVVVGGNIKNSGLESGTEPAAYAHGRVTSGRLRVFGAGLQRTRGLADFRFDGAAPAGLEHQLVNVRSEGEKGATGQPSAFAYVPDGARDVALLVTNSAGSWSKSGEGASSFVDFRGGGRVRLLGNTADHGAGRLVAHASSDLEVVALGNTVRDAATSPQVPSRWQVAANLFAAKHVFGKTTRPAYQPLGAASPTTGLGMLNGGEPEIAIPAPLRRPRVDRPLAGMVDVTTTGAVPDDGEDDTAAVRQALARSRLVWFPAGEFEVSAPFGLADPGSGGVSLERPGGALLGAGSDRTTVTNAGGGVLSTRGMAFAQIQGLTLVSGSHDDGVATVELENDREVGHATQSNNFYDFVVRGGGTGIAIGNESADQCSENLFVDTSVEGATVGVSIGNYNALANIFYHARFADLEQGIGHYGRLVGGTWSVYGGEFHDIRDTALAPRAAANGVWFLDHVRSDAAKVLATPMAGAPINVYFNQSNVGGGRMAFYSGGGLILAGTPSTRSALAMVGRIAENYLVTIEGPRFAAVEHDGGTTWVSLRASR